jgi:hypothetical protein
MLRSQVISGPGNCSAIPSARQVRVPLSPRHVEGGSSQGEGLPWPSNEHTVQPLKAAGAKSALRSILRGARGCLFLFVLPSRGQHVRRRARRTFRYRPRVGRDCLAHRLTFPLLPFQLLMCDHLATPIEFEALNSAAIAA